MYKFIKSLLFGKSDLKDEISDVKLSDLIDKEYDECIKYSISKGEDIKPIKIRKGKRTQIVMRNIIESANSSIFMYVPNTVYKEFDAGNRMQLAQLSAKARVGVAVELLVDDSDTGNNDYINSFYEGYSFDFQLLDEETYDGKKYPYFIVSDNRNVFVMDGDDNYFLIDNNDCIISDLIRVFDYLWKKGYK